MNNRVPPDLAYRVRVGANLWSGHESEDTLSSLKALGVEYRWCIDGIRGSIIAISFNRNGLAGLLTAAYRIEDDIIYSLPSRPLAHLMTPDRLVTAAVRGHPEALVRYVAPLDETARPAACRSPGG